MADEEKPGGEDQHSRMAMGMAFGVPIGVVVSLLLDSWAFIGVGIALGAAFGAIPSSKEQPSEDGAPDEKG